MNKYEKIILTACTISGSIRLYRLQLLFHKFIIIHRKTIDFIGISVYKISINGFTKSKTHSAIKIN